MPEPTTSSSQPVEPNPPQQPVSPEGTTQQAAPVQQIGPEDQSSPNLASETSPVDTQSSANVESTQSDTLPQQPEIVEKETVVVKQKGGGGGFSLKKCCCLGCFVIILAIMALVAAFYFSRDTLMEHVDNWINRGINVPEVTKIDTTQIEKELEEAVFSYEETTIEVTQDEFNNLIEENLLSSDDGDKIDIISEFMVREAKTYIKIKEPSLPWIVIDMTSNDSGEAEIGSVRMGPITFGEEQVKQALTDMANEDGENIEEFGVNDLVGYLLFGDDASKIDVQGVEFRKGMVVVSVIGKEMPEEVPPVE